MANEEKNQGKRDIFQTISRCRLSEDEEEMLIRPKEHESDSDLESPLERLKDLGISDQAVKDIALAMRFTKMVIASKKCSMFCLSHGELIMLHDVVCLGVEHEDFQDVSPAHEEVVKSFREVCRGAWERMGLTPDEAKRMDVMRLTATERKKHD